MPFLSGNLTHFKPSAEATQTELLDQLRDDDAA
jgi:hypothetical protein